MPQLKDSQAAEGIAVFEDKGLTYHLSLLDAEQNTQQQLSSATAQQGAAARSSEPTLSLASFAYIMHTSC